MPPYFTLVSAKICGNILQYHVGLIFHFTLAFTSLLHKKSETIFVFFGIYNWDFEHMQLLKKNDQSKSRKRTENWEIGYISKKGDKGDYFHLYL